ncbi:hypothetical protein HDU87_006195 [Geranomyces variabilis]|uniref:RRM domain-containing protein n=1 Tax=Geranomyces variabilis TaxID=109894 RepID=A0AAD5TG14_9FUNG|nr:hypothetical protein HDU87_006195 [Geranomyces variabilis]
MFASAASALPPPSPAPAQPSPPPLATNTLIITNLSPAAFATADAQQTRAACEHFGELSQFVPLKAFGRALVVYKRTADAQKARRLMHETDVAGSRVRVYFGQHTDTSHLLDPSLGTHIDHLRVPALERNFLLSPPGSPPIDWVQIRESSPVSGGHSDVLRDALRELHDDDFCLDDGGGADSEEEDEGEDGWCNNGDEKNNSESSSSTPGRHVLVFSPPAGSHAARSKLGIADLPVIIVENTDLEHTQRREHDDGLGTAAAVSTAADTMAVPEIVMPEDEPQWPRRQTTPLPKTAMPPGLSSGW